MSEHEGMRRCGDFPLVVAWLDDVLYPARMYREGACRMGARLLRHFFGIDMSDTLESGYRPGSEEAVVRKAVNAHLPEADDRLVSKVAQAMAAHVPCVAPYEDAREAFGILHGMGVSLGLIGEGAILSQRLVAEQLGADRLFHQILYTDPSWGSSGWVDTVLLLELLLGRPGEKAVLVSADPVRSREAGEKGWRVFHIRRQGLGPAPADTTARLIPMGHLYALPEALGLVAWTKRNGVR